MNEESPSNHLAALVRGARARVAAVLGEPGLARRLLEMGLTPGTEVRMLRAAPLGDPLEIEVRGYRLTLRLSEARNVRLQS